MNVWKDVILKEKLKELATKLGLHITEIQLLLAQERFLARIAAIGKSENYIVKGGFLMLRLYPVQPTARFTIDIDLLAKNISINTSEKVLEQAMKKDLKDGFKFLSLKKSLMKRETPYGGERFEIKWSQYGKENPQLLRIDICTGDKVSENYISSNDFFLIPNKKEELSLKVYPPEYIFAEKLETLARFQTGNTRLKDIIDLWSLTKIEISKKNLSTAISNCFKQRKTNLNKNDIIKILSDKDYLEYLEKFKAKKYKKLNLPSIKDIVDEIIKKLMPIDL